MCKVGVNMSRRRNSSQSDSGCLVALFPIIMVLGIVGAVLQFIAENIGAVFIVLLVVGAVVGIVIAVNSASKKRQEAEAERQRNVDIVNAPERKPSLVAIPSMTGFSNKEEEAINEAFRAYLRHQNDVTLAKAHLEYLENKIKALRFLERSEEAAQLDSSISQARSELARLQSKRSAVFESKYASAFYRSTEVKNAYTAFLTKLPNERIELIGDFFQNPQVKIAKVNSSSALIFCPSYIIRYAGISQNLKILAYADMSVSSWVTTERLEGPKKATDEIEHIGYLYETKAGYRDMRYSYANNPSFTYVYRGEVTIRVGGTTYEQKFPNKSQTELFEKNLKAYISLMSGKYKASVGQALLHNEELLSAGTVEAFIAQQAAADKLKAEAERAEREKRMAAQREREAKEAAKREAERQEREAREARDRAERLAEERRRQEKAAFLNSLSIVDGELTSWYGNDKKFVLPLGMATIIGTAFRWKTSLESVELPDDIVCIKANAFHGSTGLKKVILPESIVEIGKEAFTGCSGLTEVKLPGRIKTISKGLFSKCSALKEIVIPNGVKTIEESAFSGCSSLKEIAIPEGVTSIGDGAFENCSGLEKVVFPDSLVKLGKNVFSGCAALNRVVLGRGIKRIPDGCFNNHQKLLEVAVAPDLIEIGDRAFKNCQKLKQLVFIEKASAVVSKGLEYEKLLLGATTLPHKQTLEAVEKIGKSAFENCFAFTGISMKPGLRVVGDYAFANCHAIRSVEIPKSVQQFGVGVFTGCIALTNVIGSENVKWQKKGCFIGTPWLSTQATNGFVVFDGYLEAYTGSEEIVEIPSNVRVIGHNAFDSNAFVSTVVIPQGVTSIEEMAFANCRKLKTVQIPDSVSQIEDNAFANDTGFVIQCSRGSVASSFRIRNKIPGEYISKTKPTEAKETSVGKRTRSNVGDGLSGLSEDELRVIMEMRRQKMVQKKAETEKLVEPEKTEYALTDYDVTKVKLQLQDGRRVITNNIFNLQFIRQMSSSDGGINAEYETFVIDANGQVISGIKTISVSKDDKEQNYKVTYSLSAQEKFDKSAAYYVVLRYKGAGTNVLSKTQFQVDIAFASDFDF